MVTGSTPPLPPDPLQLRRRLLLQGGGFALVLLAAFSSSLYWGIALQRQDDQRTELRQLAATAAAQLPLIEHEVREPAGHAKFIANQRVLAPPGLDHQRVQWFDRRGGPLLEQGDLPLPSAPAPPPPLPLWQQWQGGVSLRQPVYAAPAAGRPPELIGYVRVALSDRPARTDLQRLRRGLLLGALVSGLVTLMVGRRMLEAAFAPLQRQLAVLQRFTAEASHELRHPLTSMRALLAAVPPAQRRAGPWQELDGLSQRMATLLEDLLLLARLEQGGLEAAALPQHFDLLELLEDLLRCQAPLARGRGISLRLSPAPEHNSLMIRSHSGPLQRLFTNLLANAIRHSPDGGEVAVEVSPRGQRLQVAVIDTGDGIPLPQRERLFERFWRGSDPHGPGGLGLAIARTIARRHGGELWLGESRPGRCVLLVELPIELPS